MGYMYTCMYTRVHKIGTNTEFAVNKAIASKTV